MPGGFFGGLSSMFGGGSPAAEGDMSNAGGAFGNASSLYGNMAGYGGTNMGYWGQDNPAYHQSMFNLAQQLGQTPTQQQQAQVLGNENAGAASIYAKARAQLMSQAASMGLDTAGDQGNQSSVLGGGLSSLSQGYANTMANNATNYYNQYLSPAAQQQRLMEQNSIYGQLASTDWSQGMKALGNAAQGYMSVGQGWDNLADAALQNQQMANSGWGDILGGVGHGLGDLIGSGKLGADWFGPNWIGAT